MQTIQQLLIHFPDFQVWLIIFWCNFTISYNLIVSVIVYSLIYLFRLFRIHNWNPLLLFICWFIEVYVSEYPDIVCIHPSAIYHPFLDDDEMVEWSKVIIFLRSDWYLSRIVSTIWPFHLLDEVERITEGARGVITLSKVAATGSDSSSSSDTDSQDGGGKAGKGISF